MNTKIGAALLAMSLTIASAAHADSRYTFENRSGIAIDQIYMSKVTDPYWRNDLLGGGILWSGDDTTILRGWGYYDVKLVDRDGDDCVVNNVAIPAEGTLTITGEWLLRCEGYGYVYLI